MINRLIHRFLLRRHFWRYATFSEVAELYTSRMLRMAATNIASALMSVFLYQNGYSILFIAGYWALYFGLKIFMALPAACYVAHFGPKHTILLANLLYIPAMLVFSFVPQWGIPAIIATGLLQGASATLYNLGHLIDFSKVKSVDHAGKEIAYMNIVEKIATSLSPLIGGLLAFAAGPQVTLWAAAALFALASLPLLTTAEPTKLGQRLIFRGFPWRMAWRSLVASTAHGYDVLASGTAWTLFVAVIILGVAQDNVIYGQLGALLSVVLLAALFASYAYGKLIDRRKGGELLRLSVIANSLVHVTRPFITTPVGVAMANVANEAATTGYVMAFTRGVFDTADLSGHRITYLGCVELVMNLGATLAGVAFFTSVLLLGDEQGMQLFFFIAAAFGLLIAAAKFQLYRK
jgi:predicted MFS family arabinose efflux permease